jgi:hypothetical protein
MSLHPKGLLVIGRDTDRRRSFQKAVRLHTREDCRKRERKANPQTWWECQGSSILLDLATAAPTAYGREYLAEQCRETGVPTKAAGPKDRCALTPTYFGPFEGLLALVRRQSE